MKKAELMRLLEEKLELEPDSLKGDVGLKVLPVWDSLAVMTFIVLADRHFGVKVTGAQIAGCDTVSDLFGLLGDKLED